jgi:hypothetical protein
MFAGAYNDIFELEKGETQMQALRRNQQLVDSVFEKTVEVLKQPPWSLAAFEYDPTTFSYVAVSGRRRSPFVDGFEDFKIWIRPILNAETSNGPHFHIPAGSDGRSLADLTFKSDRSTLVSMSMNVELYVSRYNTNDNSYWTRPTESQELIYRSALLKSLEMASQRACSALKLKSTTVDGSSSRCTESMTPSIRK